MGDGDRVGFGLADSGVQSAGEEGGSEVIVEFVVCFEEGVRRGYWEI